MGIKKASFNGISILFLIFVIFVSPGFIEKDVVSNSEIGNKGIFTYMVNNKKFTMENVKAYMRNTTGGRKELSLSNDRFVKFFFINPSAKNFDLSTPASRTAIIRYNEPGTNYVYYPKTGFVNIKNLNDSTKVLSGEFEMEMVMQGKDKVIRITNGEIINVPILFIK
jgi:hypothetical protein